MAEQERLLNRDRLIELWPVLSLDQRVRDLWETRFPELRARTVRNVSEQRRIARIALEATGPEAGFALAGSGAIREHGFIDRPTEDVDLFTIQSAQHEFASALERVVAALREAGYDVQIREQRPCFSRLVLSRGSAEPVVTADLGVVAWDRWLEARVHMRNASCTAAVALETSVWVSSVRWRMRRVVVTRSRTDG